MGIEYTETVFHGNTISAIPRHRAQDQIIPMGHLDKLAELRKRKGWTQGDLAERMGVEQPTIQRWEKGKREPSLDQLFRLAEALDVSPSTLLEPANALPVGPRLFIKGEVAAGVWRDAAELPPADWQTFTGRPDVNAETEHRFGLRVVGDSMDAIYPPGSIVECVSVFSGIDVQPGKRVIVCRTNDAGESEATVKELVEQDGELWLVPRSHNPVHVPIRLSQPEPGIAETRILAVVVASIRPE